jgi:hypothetical protein
VLELQPTLHDPEAGRSRKLPRRAVCGVRTNAKTWNLSPPLLIVSPPARAFAIRFADRPRRASPWAGLYSKTAGGSGCRRGDLNPHGLFAH